MISGCPGYHKWVFGKLTSHATDLEFHSEKKLKEIKMDLTEEILYSKIFLMRKQKVILGYDLASMYEVEPKVLNQAVKRNVIRFPADFMFQLTTAEWSSLRSRFVTLDGRGKFPKYLPYAFTEQGVSMLSSVLKSKRAIEINIQIMRFFVQMRQMISEYEVLLTKIGQLEKAQTQNKEEIFSIYKIIKGLLEPTIKNRPKIGFKVGP